MRWWNPFSWGASKEPVLEPIPDNEQGRMLAQQIAQAEAAYGQMYESNPTAAYSEMKESSYEAIRIARELGLPVRVADLEKKLEQRKQIFRGQLS